MKFKTIYKIVDVSCDCGCDDLKLLTYDEIAEMKCIKSVRFNQGYKCKSCGCLVTVPFMWIEIKK